MTIAALPEAKKRIRGTCPSSPLAAFRTNNPHFVNLVFANTVATQRAIRLKPKDYLGSFHESNLQLAEQAFEEYFNSLQDVAC